MGIKYSIRIYKKKKTLPNKMKFAFSLLALAVHADDDIVEDDVWQGAGTANAAAVGPRSGAGGVLDADRRYDDLTDIAKKHWQCLKWAKVDQSILLTTSAKPTRTVKSVSVKSMATGALARLFATLGSTLQSKVTLFLPTQLVPAKESSLSVMFNLSRTHLPTRTTSMRIITLSGAQPVSTMSLTKTAPQAVLYQLNTNAAVA